MPNLFLGGVGVRAVVFDQCGRVELKSSGRVVDTDLAAVEVDIGTGEDVHVERFGRIHKLGAGMVSYLGRAPAPPAPAPAGYPSAWWTHTASISDVVQPNPDDPRRIASGPGLGGVWNPRIRGILLEAVSEAGAKPGEAAVILGMSRAVVVQPVEGLAKDGVVAWSYAFDALAKGVLASAAGRFEVAFSTPDNKPPELSWRIGEVAA